MSNTTRITALESAVVTLADQQAQIIALLEGRAKAASTKPGRKATTAKRKGTKGRAAQPQAPAVRYLSSKSRKDFIKAHGWAEDHTSTRALAELVVVGGQPLAKGWAVGEGYRSLFADATPKAAKPAKKASKKGAKRTAAKVEASAPAKVRAAEGPRDAKGHITPKAQWALRERLAESGKFDRHEIDTIVEAQLA